MSDGLSMHAAGSPSALATARGDWATFGLIDDIRPALDAARNAKQPCAMVTLFGAEGGVPRGLGAQMLITQTDIAGYLSGGCIEADVTHHALATIADGLPRTLVYGRGGPVDIRLPCGGHIDVLVEKIAPDDHAAQRLLTLWRARQAALWLSNGSVRTCHAAGEALPDTAPLHVAAMSGRVATPRSNATSIYRRFLPRNRLVIVGWDPAALALATFAAQSGLETILVRPNGPEAAPPISGLRYLRTAPGCALMDIGPDASTAVVVATHDDVHDDDTLFQALRSDAGYVGLLGSSRRLPQKLGDLRRRGVDESAIARLKAPIGLPLGGRAPWQIATSILAEIIQWSAAAERSHVWNAQPESTH